MGASIIRDGKQAKSNLKERESGKEKGVSELLPDACSSGRPIYYAAAAPTVCQVLIGCCSHSALKDSGPYHKYFFRLRELSFSYCRQPPKP